MFLAYCHPLSPENEENETKANIKENMNSSTEKIPVYVVWTVNEKKMPKFEVLHVQVHKSNSTYVHQLMLKTKQAR